MVDQRDGADEKQNIVPWPQSIPELGGLGTSSSHPGPSHRSSPVLPWQLPSGHSSCRFLSPPFMGQSCAPGPERRVSPWPRPVSCLQARAPSPPPPLIPPGRACSSGALLSPQGSKDQKSNPFPVAPKSLLFNQLPTGGKGGVSSPCVIGISLSEASEQTPSSWLTGHDFSSFL